MRRRTTVTMAILGGTVLLLAVSACGARPPGRAAVTIRRIRPVSSALNATVIIDPTVGETFTPVTGVIPALTATQAWSQFLGQSSVPSDVTVQLGQLTLPLGAGAPNQYMYNGRLVWAYDWHSCPATSLGSLPSGNPCIEWLFLDANSGQELDNTWQQ